MIHLELTQREIELLKDCLDEENLSLLEPYEKELKEKLML